MARSSHQPDQSYQQLFFWIRTSHTLDFAFAKEMECPIQINFSGE